MKGSAQRPNSRVRHSLLSKQRIRKNHHWCEQKNALAAMDEKNMEDDLTPNYLDHL